MPVPRIVDRPLDSRLDALARRLAGGISRREALRVGGVALLGAATATPAGAIARLTRRCPAHHVDCHGRCCQKGEVCLPPEHTGGKHRCGCPDKKTRCADECVNLQSDPHNCGRCGHRCGAGQSCVAGQCTTECPTGQTVCAGACVELATDPQHCGACSTACQPGDLCANGQCASECPAGYSECSGGCVDLQTSTGNCGTCGHACPANATCVNATCRCPQGMTECSGVCVNLQSDADNCGTCGTTCSSYFATSSCVSGTCHIDSCAPGWINCSGNPLDGCNCLGTTCNGTMCPS